MHPQSRNRSNNKKVVDDATKALVDPKADAAVPTARRSKYGAKLAALRRKSHE